MTRLSGEQEEALRDVLARAAAHIATLPGAAMVELAVYVGDEAPSGDQQWTALSVAVTGVPIFGDDWRFALPWDDRVDRSAGTYWLALASVIHDEVTPWLREHGIGSTFTRPDPSTFRVTFVRARWR